MAAIHNPEFPVDLMELQSAGRKLGCGMPHGIGFSICFDSDSCSDIVDRDPQLYTLSVVIPGDSSSANEDLALNVLKKKIKVQLGYTAEASVLHTGQQEHQGVV